MIVALDYDGTYTADPTGWDRVISVLKARGHRVLLVTIRRSIPRELPPVIDGVYCTRYRAKREFMTSQGITVDVWIDDMPWAIDNEPYIFGKEDE